jgi:hypothetical protein
MGRVPYATKPGLLPRLYPQLRLDDLDPRKGLVEVISLIAAAMRPTQAHRKQHLHEPAECCRHAAVEPEGKGN